MSPSLRALLLFALLCAAPSLPGASTYFVSRYDDTAPSTGGVASDLRFAIHQALADPGSEVQIFGPRTIVLQGPLPILTTSLIVSSVGGASVISGNSLHRIFFVDAPSQTVEFRNLELRNGRAKGGDGGIGGGGGGLGAGGAIFVNRGSVVVNAVLFAGNAAVGGKGGDGTDSTQANSTYGAGGGGGLGGNGGAGHNGVFGGGGGGGFGGNGGDGRQGTTFGAGGGGGLIAPGGQGSDISGFCLGGGGGALGPGANATGQNGGDGGAGGGGNGGGENHPSSDGLTNGGGGGGGRRISEVFYGGGKGGRFGGGGAGGGRTFVARPAGDGGEFGGGGGDNHTLGAAGNGGWGGGGGGGSCFDSGSGNVGDAGDGGFGAGGGGANALGHFGGPYGGRGGNMGASGDIGGGGGGGALGADVFVRLGATFSAQGATAAGGSLQAGLGGFTRNLPNVRFPEAGAARGTSIFTQEPLVFSGPDNQSVGGTIEDDTTIAAAGLQKSGTGTLTLTGANTFRGDVIVAGGTVSVPTLTAAGVAGPLGAGQALQLTGGTLAYTGGTAAPTRPIVLGAAGGTIQVANAATTVSLGAVVSGAGSLTKSGPGKLTLLGANSFAGSLTVTAGTLQLGADDAAAFSGGSNITNATTFILQKSDDLVLNGFLAGAGTFIKRGAGGLRLNGPNFQTGPFQLESGRLELGANAALGTGPLTILGGEIRAAGAPRTVDNALTLSGGFIVGRFTTFTSPASVTLPTLTITAENFDGAADADSVFSGAISGATTLSLAAGPHGIGTGAIVFQGANTYSGGTVLLAGSRLAIFTDAGLGAAGTDLTLTDGRLRLLGTVAGTRTVVLGTVGGEIETNGFDGTFANLSGPGPLTKSGAGTLTLTGVLNHAGPITVSGGTLQLASGQLTGVISGAGGLAKAGPGTLTLPAGQAYTGATTLTGGTLVLAGDSASSACNVGAGTVLELQAAANRDYAPAGNAVVFSGTGTLRKTGPGGIVWGSAAATFALGAGGLIDVQAGNFTGGSFANENWVNNFAGLQVAAGASFGGVEADVRVDALTGAGFVFSGFTGGAGSFTCGVAGGSGLFSGVVGDVNTGAGALGRFIKAGAGTQILTGANTYTGGTTIAAGTLQIGNNGTSGSIVGNVANAGALAFRRIDDIVFAGAISGAGAVSHGGGTLTLSGASPATGTLSILSGRVLLSGTYAGGCNATGRLSLAGGSIGSASASSVVQAGGQIDGSGTVLGAVANSGLITAGPGESLAFGGGAVTNAGGAVLRALSGGTLNFSGATSLVNNGLIDLISGTITFPASFTNNGVLLDSSVVQVKAASRAGNVLTVTIQGYAAHSYRLQKSTDLGATTFVNVGSAQSGAGAELTFTDTDASAHAFYRVAVD